MHDGPCPLCHADLTGEPIPEAYREHYGNKTHNSRMILVEVWGVYDGGLYYRCPDCGGAWHRWEPGRWQYEKAIPYIERDNARRTTAPPS